MEQLQIIDYLRSLDLCVFIRNHYPRLCLAAVYESIKPLFRLSGLTTFELNLVKQHRTIIDCCADAR
jgi:hypothetical protein